MGIDAGEVFDLVAAREAGGHDEGGGLLFADGGQEHAFTDGLGNAIMFALIAE